MILPAQKKTFLHGICKVRPAEQLHEHHPLPPLRLTSFSRKSEHRRRWCGTDAPPLLTPPAPWKGESQVGAATEIQASEKSPRPLRNAEYRTLPMTGAARHRPPEPLVIPFISRSASSSAAHGKKPPATERAPQFCRSSLEAEAATRRQRASELKDLWLAPQPIPSTIRHTLVLIFFLTYVIYRSAAADDPDFSASPTLVLLLVLAQI